MSSTFDLRKLAAQIFALPEKKPYTGFDASCARSMTDEARQRRDEKELKEFNAIKENLFKQVYQAIHIATQEERTHIRIASEYSIYYKTKCDLQWCEATMRIFVKECQKHFEDQGYSFTYNLINTSEDCAHIYIKWKYPNQ